MSTVEDNEAFEDSSFGVTHKDGRNLVITGYVTDTGEVVMVADCIDLMIEPTEEDLADPGRTIMVLLIKEIITRFKNQAGGMKAADFEFCRKLLSDNSITLTSIRAGNFGAIAQRAAEEFEYPHPPGIN